jgi:hypothetical protein
MKPPSSTSRFRAPIRHYHRHNNRPQDDSWDAWIGAEQKTKFRFLIPLLTLAALLVVSALLVVGYALLT